MPRSWRSTLLAALSVPLLAAPFACRRGPAPRIDIANVERCERGLEAAASAPTLEQAMSMHYRECSELYAEAQCRKAFVEASKTDREALLVAFGPCAKAYCPLLQVEDLEACSPGFKATPQSLWSAWPPMHKAILDLDAAGYVPRIERSMMQFQFRIQALPGAASAAPAGSAAR